MLNYSRIAPILSDIDRTVASVERLTGGYSHEAWLVHCSSGERVVVRFGEADSGVEAAVLALAGSVVPAPKVLASGDGFSVLRFVAGETLEAAFSREIDQDNLKALASELGQIVARIGTVEFDRPGFFGTDQLLPASEEAWSGQLPKFCAAQLAGSRRLTAAEADAWAELCQHNAEALVEIDPFRRLVHSDMNPKNIIVTQIENVWRVAAIIDWEFAYSGCPFADAANMCRFPSEYPAGFLSAFTKSFELAAPQLTDNWRHQARVLDMFALSALAAKPDGHVIGDKAAIKIREWISNGIPPLGA